MNALPLQITTTYALFFALMLLPLIFIIIRGRWAKKISVGDKGDWAFSHKVRAHGNFMETVPFILFLMMISEVNHAPVAGLHLVGATLLLGRLLHAHGMCNIYLKTRFIGMILTISSLICAIGLIGYTLFL